MKKIIILAIASVSTSIFAGSFNCTDNKSQKIEFSLNCKSKRSCEMDMKRNLNITKQQISVPLGTKLKGTIKKNRLGDKGLYLYVDLNKVVRSDKWSKPHFRLDNVPSKLDSDFVGNFVLRAYNDSLGAARDVLEASVSCRSI